MRLRTVNLLAQDHPLSSALVWPDIPGEEWAHPVCLLASCFRRASPLSGDMACAEVDSQAPCPGLLPLQLGAAVRGLSAGPVRMSAVSIARS